MKNEFIDKQNEINTNMATAMLDVIPDHWYSIELKSESNMNNLDKGALGYSISNPDGETDLVIVSEELLQHCVELEQLFLKYQSLWDSFSFIVLWDDAIDSWRFTIDYAYADDEIGVN